jgi:hypothetical protein
MHVLRPLFVVLAIAGLILIARIFVVPDDFGIHESGYMYGWYRKGNEEEWKALKAKYQGKDYFIKTGFDEEYSRLSPGIHILSESIKEAFATGCSEYDLLGQNEGYKMKFTDSVRVHCKYWVFNNTPYGKLLYQLENRTVAALRQLLRKQQTVQAELVEKK